MMNSLQTPGKEADMGTNVKFERTLNCAGMLLLNKLLLEWQHAIT